MKVSVIPADLAMYDTPLNFIPRFIAALFKPRTALAPAKHLPNPHSDWTSGVVCNGMPSPLTGTNQPDDGLGQFTLLGFVFQGTIRTVRDVENVLGPAANGGNTGVVQFDVTVTERLAYL
jgi:hypothetical protein